MCLLSCAECNLVHGTLRMQNSLLSLTAGLFFSSPKAYVSHHSWVFELRGWTKYLYFFLKKSFYLLPRWDNRVAKYLISIMLGHFHLDAEHFSWNDFKICRINAIFFFVWWLFLCCSKWEWELSVAREVEGRWQKLIPIYSSFWEKGPADFPLFPPSADKILFWSCCVNTLEFAREQLQQTSCFRFFKSPWHCSLTVLYSVPFRLPPSHLFVGFSCPVCLPVVFELLSLILGRGGGGGKDPAESY